MRNVFQKELEKLNVSIVKMGTILEGSINDMIVCIHDLDRELAEKIIKRDDEIDEMERCIEKDCIALLAKQQPFASDLRKVSSYMKIVTDIERIADHCADIAKYVIRLIDMKNNNKNQVIQQNEIENLTRVNDHTNNMKPMYIDEMILAMSQMVRETIDSFVHQDIERAKRVCDSDDIVDDYFRKIVLAIKQDMIDNNENIPQNIEYLFIVKYLERMGDHAVNIATWVEYIVTGKLV